MPGGQLLAAFSQRVLAGLRLRVHQRADAAEGAGRRLVELETRQRRASLAPQLSLDGAGSVSEERSACASPSNEAAVVAHDVDREAPRRRGCVLLDERAHFAAEVIVQQHSSEFSHSKV